jgi:hypothetical protein
MRRVHRHLAFAAFVLAAGSAHAQDTYDPRWWSDQLIDRIARNDVAGAFTMIRADSHLGKVRGPAVGVIGRALTDAGRAFGSGLDYRLIGRSRLGTSMQQLTYLVMYERAALTIELTFMRPMLTWNLVNVQAQPTGAPPVPERRS